MPRVVLRCDGRVGANRSCLAVGVRTEQDLYVRLIDSVTKQVSVAQMPPPHLSVPLFGFVSLAFYLLINFYVFMSFLFYFFPLCALQAPIHSLPVFLYKLPSCSKGLLGKASVCKPWWKIEKSTSSLAVIRMKWRPNAARWPLVFIFVAHNLRRTEQEPWDVQSAAHPWSHVQVRCFCSWPVVAPTLKWPMSS